MSYDGKILARARESLELVKQTNIAEHDRRCREIYYLIPEIRRIDDELKSSMARLVRLTMQRGSDSEIDAIRDNAVELRMRKAELLSGNDYPVDYLEEIFTCPLCHDTGMVTEISATGASSRICSCLEKIYNRELTKELSTLMKGEGCCFELFSLDVYDDFPDRDGNIPRKVMEMNLNVCRSYASQFPAVSKNLLFQGGTGLGKTFLSACIAGKVSAGGYSVCYESTAAALEAFEKEKFSRDPAEAKSASDKVRFMQECDLMILDDLGTEMPTPVNMSALYTLINSRLINNRRMIISTNLSDPELQGRYTKQICSRLMGEFTTLPFVGSDLRLKKKS